MKSQCTDVLLLLSVLYYDSQSLVSTGHNDNLSREDWKAIIL